MYIQEVLTHAKMHMVHIPLVANMEFSSSLVTTSALILLLHTCTLSVPYRLKFRGTNILLFSQDHQKLFIKNVQPPIKKLRNACRNHSTKDQCESPLKYKRYIMVCTCI